MISFEMLRDLLLKCAYRIIFENREQYDLLNVMVGHLIEGSTESYDDICARG